MNKLIFVLIAFSTAFASIHLSADDAVKETGPVLYFFTFFAKIPS